MPKARVANLKVFTENYSSQGRRGLNAKYLTHCEVELSGANLKYDVQTKSLSKHLN
jgi:hypothetical protein